jgi:hypothetical protein
VTKKNHGVIEREFVRPQIDGLVAGKIWRARLVDGVAKRE